MCQEVVDRDMIFYRGGKTCKKKVDREKRCVKRRWIERDRVCQKKVDREIMCAKKRWIEMYDVYKEGGLRN